MIVCNAISLLCKKNCFPMAASEVFMVARRKKSTLASNSCYSIVKLLIADGKFGEIQPFLSRFVKEYGIFEPKVSKILLHYICLNKDVNSALHFINMIKEHSVAVTVPVSVIRALNKVGRFLAAYKLIVGAKDEFPFMDVIDYSIIINGLCKGGFFIEALNMCALAENKGIKLNIVTYNSVINGLCNQGCFVEAFRLFDSLERIELVPSEITYSTLIDNLCKQGYLLDAKLLFDRMVLKGYEVNIRVYNSFLIGYCKFGQLEEALKILKNVQIQGLDPDEFTVSSMIYGYCQMGDMEGALTFFFEYKQNSVSPDFLGFSYLIRGLYAKGRMEEARSILREMLQSQSAIELMNRVNTGVETESIESFLVFLCEQGSIKEAVAVLDEVVSMFFPVQKCGIPCESQELQKLSELDACGVFAPRIMLSTKTTDLDSVSCNAMTDDKMVESSDDLESRCEFNRFDSYYSLIASMCSRGELSDANKLAKEMLTGLGGNC